MGGRFIDTKYSPCYECFQMHDHVIWREHLDPSCCWLLGHEILADGGLAVEYLDLATGYVCTCNIDASNFSMMMTDEGSEDYFSSCSETELELDTTDEEEEEEEEEAADPIAEGESCDAWDACDTDLSCGSWTD